MTTRPNVATAQRGRRGAARTGDAPELLVGRTLEGRYRLDEVLNTGGMGIVFRATQLNVGRTVALKILKPTLSKDPSLKERFHLEVEAVAQISHPNVVKLIDCGEDGSGLLYLVMEYVEGKTLRECLRAGDLRLWEILEVFAQVCTALIEIHGQQVIHRDLKFDNIMVQRMRDRRLVVQLLDFGVAKLLSQNRQLTEVGQVPGTPAIVAPELVDGEEPTAQSDLYSLGILVFTTLVGRAPFEAENDLALMRAHKHEDVPNLSRRVDEEVPQEVVDLANELLSKDPQMRPPSAEAVRHRLETIGARYREEYPDMGPYYPPQSEGLEEPSQPALDAADAEAIESVASGGSEADEERRGWIGVLFPRPLVAPMTVTASLSLLLMILVIILIYLVYQEIQVLQ